mmetsp:Transcript_9693/g.58676  ORF Transcript_9693/g.58676 Transcript_9693/m.58676 type:complete len:563 (+) Transcript_9693:282-1970(+)
MALEYRIVPKNRYWWILVLGFFFAAYDAFGIGSNDVANSFANAVSAKSLTLKQAVVIAGVMEFVGALFLGSSVTDTVRSNIIDPNDYDNQSDVLMLGMLCASIGSSVWVNMATKFGMPVSTTHATIGSVIGFGIAFGGADSINWGAWDDGVIGIVVGWGIAPVLAGMAAVAIYLITDFTVLRTEDSFNRALKIFPVYVFFSFMLISFFMFYKGFGRYESTFQNMTWGSMGNPWPMIFIAAGVGLAGGLFTHFFLVRYLRKKYQDLPDDPDNVILSPSKIDPESAVKAHAEANAPEKWPWYKKYAITAFNYLFGGLDKDVVSIDANDAHMVSVHESAKSYGTRTEKIFSSMQIFTSSFSALAHGSNDVANAVGPFSAVFYFWNNDSGVVSSKSDVPTWILAYGGFFISLGLAIQGWRMMAVMGNHLTKITPSRGFAMEMGAVVAVLIASDRGLPVSTTQCIIGATIAVGLVNPGVWRAINWRMAFVSFTAWVITVPAAGLVSGLIFSFVAFSPKIQDCSGAFGEVPLISGDNGTTWQPFCIPRPYGFMYTDEFYTNASILVQS